MGNVPAASMPDRCRFGDVARPKPPIPGRAPDRLRRGSKQNLSFEHAGPVRLPRSACRTLQPHDDSHSAAVIHA
ncbi:hypothetical protein LA76x_4684 [Lysobacter antibioticus]|uniref:Uncharacterized protein n=1 Tax=Lysobacter antibioticus TaxID=84531 RepID=A0A0S2FGY2_LYSAN|nr:hypothetical protein LA76x_4684 [Lysobacter antibioticus]